MKTNPNDPAFGYHEIDTRHDTLVIERGLTKREYFIGQAMAGMLANADFLRYSVESRSIMYIAEADALIERLNKEQP